MLKDASAVQTLKCLLEQSSSLSEKCSLWNKCHFDLIWRSKLLMLLSHADHITWSRQCGSVSRGYLLMKDVTEWWDKNSFYNALHDDRQAAYFWSGYLKKKKKAILEPFSWKLGSFNRMTFEKFLRDVIERQLHYVFMAACCTVVSFRKAKPDFCTATSRCHGPLPPMASCRTTQSCDLLYVKPDAAHGNHDDHI